MDTRIKPIPTNNTYFAVEGFVNDVEMDSNKETPSLEKQSYLA